MAGIFEGSSILKGTTLTSTLTWVSLQKGNVKKSKKLIKIVNIEEERLHILRMNWGISMMSSGKMSLMIILKVAKKQGIHPFSEKYIFEKNKEGGVKLTPAPHSRFKVNSI